MDGLAKEVYDLISGLPSESAQIVAGMIVNEGLHWALGDADVEKAYFDSRAGELEDIKRALIRNYISKRAAGESVDSLVALADAISKTEQNKPKVGFQGKKAQEKFDPKKHPRGFHGYFEDTPGRAFSSGTDTVRALNQGFAAAQRDMNARPPSMGSGPDRMAFIPGARNAQTAGAAAHFLHSTVGGYLPPPVQVGLGAAGFVGGFAPQAQAVFGPAMDRAKYRYQGVERRLEPGLMSAVKNDVGKPENWRVQNAKGRGLREALIYGNEESDNQGNLIAWTPSATMRHIYQNWLPDQKLSELQVRSGNLPPSQGIMIDRKGQVSAQMVGSGDDWYLPFDLKNLGNLKGGEYIRTRTNGGLTTEDLYTGLMAGARSMTVVSHNGVYTIELDDTLRGSRRYSQSAREMTDRYGQLLDAVKEGRVPYGEIDPIRVQEIRQEAGNSPQIFDTLMRQERDNPRVTDPVRRAWGNEILDQIAEQRGMEAERTHLRGSVMAPRNALINRSIPAEAEKIAASRNAEWNWAREQEGLEPQPVADPKSPDIQEEARIVLSNDPEELADVNGMGDIYSQRLKQREFRYLRSLEPMTLNGPGYDFAMKALKEQFPYYVKKVQWHPWNENWTGAGQDQGYVRPRYNRPAAVRAGYFDPQITGYGKIPATRTRYQNARVTPTIETGYNPEGIAEDRRPAAEAAPGVVPAATPGAEQPKPAAAKPAAAEEVVAQRAADLGLIKAFRDATTWSMGFNSKGDQNLNEGALRNVPVRDHRAEGAWMESDPEYKYFSLKELNRVPSMTTEELHKMAQEMVRIQERDHPFDVDDAVKKWKGFGKEPVARKITDLDFGDPDLQTTNEDFDFGNRAEKPVVPGQPGSYYQELYYSDPFITALRRKDAIGDIHRDELPDQVRNYIAAEQLDYIDNVENGRSFNTQVRNIMAALMARQLHRHYKQATGPGWGSQGGRGGPPPAPPSGGSPRKIPVQVLSAGSLRPVQQQQYIPSGQLRRHQVG